MKYYHYTDEDIQFLRDVYPTGDWDAIKERFPTVTTSGIRKKCHKLGIKILTKENYKTSRRKWTKDEIDILKTKYSIVPFDEIRRELPNRSDSSIISMAKKLGFHSYSRCEQLWDASEIEYIKDNWELVPDIVMAEKLGRSFLSVKSKRQDLGLYRRDMTSFTYPNIAKYLRGQNQQWKKDSMMSCNYRCVLTGSKDFQIHHLYGVSNIINDIYNDYPQYNINDDINSYSANDLDFLTNVFIEYQSKYPLGVCVNKKIHTLFHSLYGQYYNTPEQWYQFEKDYRKGLYAS